MCSVIFIVYTRVEAGPVGKCDDVFLCTSESIFNYRRMDKRIIFRVKNHMLSSTARTQISRLIIIDNVSSLPLWCASERHPSPSVDC